MSLDLSLSLTHVALSKRELSLHFFLSSHFITIIIIIVVVVVDDDDDDNDDDDVVVLSLRCRLLAWKVFGALWSCPLSCFQFFTTFLVFVFFANALKRY
jgi:hypothetical protein